jgi:hypothetical protein
MSIPLSTILNIQNPSAYKVHLACLNPDGDEPLDVFVRDKTEWDGWNSWRSSKNEFNREFILSFAYFYLETDVWLFGGIYRVLAESRLISRAVTQLSEFWNMMN